MAKYVEILCQQILSKYFNRVKSCIKFIYFCYLLLFLFIYHFKIQGTQEQWRNVFYLCAAFSLAGGIVYVLFASAEPASWGMDLEKVEDDQTDVVPELKEGLLTKKSEEERSSHQKQTFN